MTADELTEPSEILNGIAHVLAGVRLSLRSLEGASGFRAQLARDATTRGALLESLHGAGMLLARLTTLIADDELNELMGRIADDLDEARAIRSEIARRFPHVAMERAARDVLGAVRA